MIAGHAHFPREEDVKFSRIFIGAAWPAVRPGFVAVVGEHASECILGRPKLVVLDEASDDRLWHVVERLAALREYYHPEKVLADAGHVAAMQFAADFREKGLTVEHSMLCAMDGPFGYALPVLQRAMSDARLIVPRTSLLTGELLTPPRHEDLAKLHLSDYPAIAALAFAALGLELSRVDPSIRMPAAVDTGGSILA